MERKKIIFFRWNRERFVLIVFFFVQTMPLKAVFLFVPFVSLLLSPMSFNFIANLSYFSSMTLFVL